MATQFYTRYIPPAKSIPETLIDSKRSESQSLLSKKRKRDSNLNATPSSKERKYHGQNTLVFDSEAQSHGVIDPRDSGSTERSETTISAKSNPQALGPDLEPSTAVTDAAVVNKDTVDSKKKREKRKWPVKDTELAKTNEVETNPSVGEITIPDDGPKHKKIRSKFERSSRLAAKLSKHRESAQDLTINEKRNSPAPEVHGLVPLPQPAEIPDDLGSNKISALPEWLARPLVVSSRNEISFQELPLRGSIVAALESKGLSKSFAIQSGVLPLLLPGLQQHDGDLCVSAATGSGKTFAYVLPMIESLCDKMTTKLRGLIVVPTRELVTQVRETLLLCTSGTRLKIGTAVGSRTLKEEQELLVTKGLKYDPQGYRAEQQRQSVYEDDLMNWDDEPPVWDDNSDALIDFTAHYMSNVDILVCTPGRLVDHVNSTNGFTLQNVQWLVIDEADRLLDESFQQWVDVVLPALQLPPKHNPWVCSIHKLLHVHETRELRKIILSATITKDISKLMALQLRRPKLVVLENTAIANVNVENPEAPVSSSIIYPADIELPPTLKEIAIPIKSIGDKPLYLLNLLPLDDAPYAISDSNIDHDMEAHKADGRSDITSSSNDELDSDTSSSGSGTDSDLSSSPSGVDEPTHVAGPVAKKSTHGVLIFTNNNENALRLARLLGLMRPSWAPRIASLTKSTATSTGRKILSAFRERRLSILIASDRASRGLDIQDLAQVINYDMPSSVTSYVHRVGRTARAGRAGVATTMVAHHEARWFWNEIAKSPNIHRHGKVNRVENGLESISEKDRKTYEVALKTLGQEARGEKTVV